MTTKSQSIEHIEAQVEAFWPNEAIAHLCLLLDPVLIDTPFGSWEEQKAFEIVLHLEDIERSVLGVPIFPTHHR